MKRTVFEIILVLIIILLSLSYLNDNVKRSTEINDILLKQRIAFMNRVFRDKNQSIQALQNFILLDISRIGEDFVDLEETNYSNECWGWNITIKKQYVNLLIDSSLKFSKQEGFQKNYKKGLEYLDKYCMKQHEELLNTK